MSYTMGSLFSGIGGLDRGLEMAGLGPTLWQCEIEPFNREVLAKHWPDATRYEDVTKLRGTDVAPVRILCGSPPCQDLSQAGWSVGPRKGLAGSRSGLWYEYARLIGEIQPQAVVWENVLGALGVSLDTVAGWIAEQGYTVDVTRIRASDLGAPHHRERVFVVATRPSRGLADAVPSGPQGRSVPGRGTPQVPDERMDGRGPVDAGVCGDLDGIPRGLFGPGPRGEWPNRPGEAQGAWESPRTTTRDRMNENHRHDRLRALGNAVSPQCAYVVGCRVRELLDGY